MTQRKAYQAILESKCPRCRQGDMFEFPLLKVGKFTKMYSHCNECGLRFEVEPGFFFGAMYISYAFTVAVLVTTGVILWMMNFTETILFVSTVLSIVIISLPFTFRYSRVLFLHLFGGVKYDPEYKR